MTRPEAESQVTPSQRQQSELDEEDDQLRGGDSWEEKERSDWLSVGSQREAESETDTKEQSINRAYKKKTHMADLVYSSHPRRRRR